VGTPQNMLLLLPFKSNLLCTHYNFTDVLDSMYCMFDFLHEFGLEVFCTPFIWLLWNNKNEVWLGLQQSGPFS